MAKIQDSYYFQNFIACAEHACKAADILNKTVHDFNPNDLEQRLHIIHEGKLHTECKDPLEVFAWHELYRYLEQCMDACEHIADSVEAVVMKNS